MKKEFTYNSLSNGFEVRFPVNTRVKFNNSYKKLLGMAFNATKGHEVTLITVENKLITISLSLYTQLPDDDRYIPNAWKHVVGVFVNTEEQAQMLVAELEQARMWALLKR